MCTNPYQIIKAHKESRTRSMCLQPQHSRGRGREFQVQGFKQTEVRDREGERDKQTDRRDRDRERQRESKYTNPRKTDKASALLTYQNSSNVWINRVSKEMNTVMFRMYPGVSQVAAGTQNQDSETKPALVSTLQSMQNTCHRSHVRPSSLTHAGDFICNRKGWS